MNIITNNQPRMLKCAADLPAKVQDDFDYVKWEEGYAPRFVQYKGEWYDVYDTQTIRTADGAPMGWSMVVEKDSPLASWHGIVSDSYFSGVLFKLCDDDTVIVGRYYC
jgi:hypothetical protein